MKKDKRAHLGKDIEILQIVFPQFPGQYPGAFPAMQPGIDNNELPAEKAAASALDGYFVVGKEFISDSDLQTKGHVFELLKEKFIRERRIHFSPLRCTIICKKTYESKARCGMPGPAFHKLGRQN